MVVQVEPGFGSAALTKKLLDENQREDNTLFTREHMQKKKKKRLYYGSLSIYETVAEVYVPTG